MKIIKRLEAIVFILLILIAFSYQQNNSVQTDVIVFTGDMIHNDASEENGLHLMKKLIEIAPVYFERGNHEGYLSDFKLLEDKLVQLGVSVYAKHNIDLVLAGHAHGGQVRLPFVGGIVAPNQDKGDKNKKPGTILKTDP